MNGRGAGQGAALSRKGFIPGRDRGMKRQDGHNEGQHGIHRARRHKAWYPMRAASMHLHEIDDLGNCVRHVYYSPPSRTPRTSSVCPRSARKGTRSVSSVSWGSLNHDETGTALFGWKM